jgi:hypothetical protein
LGNLICIAGNALGYFVMHMKYEQLLCDIHENITSDGGLVHIQISLIYANVSPDDILLQQKLDILATSHPNLKVKFLFRKDTMVSQSVIILSKLIIF